MKNNFFEEADGVFAKGRLAHLVQATLTANDGKHWNSYLEALAGQTPNEGEKRLFPMAAYVLRQAGIVPEQSDMIAPTEKWARLRNTVTAAHRPGIYGAFCAAGITLKWTKGTALSAQVYPEPWLRPSMDLDAIVYWKDVERIEELAAKKAWVAKFTLKKWRWYARQFNTELSYQCGPNLEIDMAWHPRMPFAHDPAFVDFILAQEGEFADVTWLLTETLDHGLSLNTVWPIRWIVDACLLIASDHKVSWPLFIEIAQRYKLQALFALGLNEVSRFSDAIPQEVLLTLNAHRPTFLERQEIQARLTGRNPQEIYKTTQSLNLIRRGLVRVFKQYLGRKQPLRHSS